MTLRRPRPHRLVRLGPLPQPVRFIGCDDLLAALRSILHGWPVRPLAARAAPAPGLRIRRTRKGYRRVSRRYPTPTAARSKERGTLVEALCGLHSEVLDWLVEEHPSHLFVHGAAVRIGARLVVFPALAKAGKSTLTVHLAAAGHTVFTDDVLPIDTATGRGLALGIVPRLRPPLPASLGRAFHRFVAQRAGLSRSNRLYVRLRRGELAPLGSTAPVRGIVLLERAPGARASLQRLDPADALERMILQNFARDRPTPVILETLASIAERSDCYALRYARCAPAITLLEQAFGGPRRRRRAGEGRS